MDSKKLTIPLIFLFIAVIVFIVGTFMKNSNYNSIVTRKVSTTTPDPAIKLAAAHQVLANNSTWHESWRRVIGPSSNYGAGALLACYKQTIVMSLKSVWDQDGSILVALNSGNGKDKWREQLSFTDKSPAIITSLVVISDHIYVATAYSNYAVAAFRLQDGQAEWFTPDFPGHTGYDLYPSLDNNLLRLYGGISSQTTVYDIDPKDGQIVSTHVFSSHDANEDAFMITAASKYTDTAQGLVHVDIQSGKTWLVPTTGHTRHWPTFLDPAKMIFTTDVPLATLFNVDTSSGAVLWKTPGNLASNHTVFKDSVYSLDANAKLTARDIATGRESGSIVFSGSPLDVNGNSDYWLASGDCGLLVYFGDSQELIDFQSN